MTSGTPFERFLLDVRMRVSDLLTADECDAARMSGSEIPDPADVHEDIRESLAPFFEEIRERVEGPRCATVIPIGFNSFASCLLLAGHDGGCEPCIWKPRSDGRPS